MKIINSTMREELKDRCGIETPFLPQLYEMKFWYHSEGKLLVELVQEYDADSGAGFMGLNRSIFDFDNEIKSFTIPEKCTLFIHEHKNLVLNIYQLETEKVVPVYYELINLENPKKWAAQEVVLSYEKNGKDVWWRNYMLYEPSKEERKYEPITKEVKLNALEEMSEIAKSFPDKKGQHIVSLKKLIPVIRYQQKHSNM